MRSHAVLGLLVVLWAGCTRPSADLTDLSAAPETDTLHTDLGPLPSFCLTDQLGRTVCLEDLRGKVWVANFFFSRCAGDCSKTNATMARLQHELAGYSNVLLVGFSVDPADDTPEVLRRYGQRWGNDPSRWLLLTGPEDQMYALIEKGFKQAVQRNPQAKPGFEVMHTFSLMIVDSQGRIRGYVDGRDIGVTPRIVERVRQLLPPSFLQRLLPALNASLNGSAALVLLLGYLAVRRRWLTAHKLLMLTALGLSTAFLACYLYYHLGVQRGLATPFTGPGWVRSLYYAILFSHIVLAAVVVPLALGVAGLALLGHWRWHRALARCTLPLWLYVSLTGVVVYWMLYHLYAPPTAG